MNIMTSELLQELDETEKKSFKPLYNYSLNTLREAKETGEDVRKEYMWNKKHTNSFLEHIKREIDRN